MEEAKSAIKKLTSHHGHQDTTVHEHHQPSVTHQHITPTRHDEGTAVVDREVHQEHYHTNVQPIHDREVLPEQHKHKVLPTEQKEYQHGDPDALKQRLGGDAAKFKDTTETGATQFTKSTNPEVGAEHVHHHIHETIQPVIEKETIQPTVVHTTKPIHEVHHNAPQHHAATVLPAVSVADFQKHGGSLTGAADRTTHHDGHRGAPVDTAGINGPSKTDQLADTTMDPRVDRRKEPLGRDAPSSQFADTRIGAGTSGNTTHASNLETAHPRHGQGLEKKKPSLIDKLNPLKDADGDGKRGIGD